MRIGQIPRGKSFDLTQRSGHGFSFAAVDRVALLIFRTDHQTDLNRRFKSWCGCHSPICLVGGGASIVCMPLLEIFNRGVGINWSTMLFGLAEESSGRREEDRLPRNTLTKASDSDANVSFQPGACLCKLSSCFFSRFISRSIT